MSGSGASLRAMTKLRLALAPVVAGVLAVSGCADMTYDERMEYLRHIAQRGVEVHVLIVSQGAEASVKRCQDAYGGTLKEELPNDRGGGPVTGEWAHEVETVFVDSCVSGKPKVLLPRDATVVPSEPGPEMTSGISPSTSISPSP